jgi:hypothetical protein
MVYGTPPPNMCHWLVDSPCSNVADRSPVFCQRIQEQGWLSTKRVREFVARLATCSD